MLVTLRDRIRTAVRAGRTLAQVQAAKLSAEFDAKWGNSFLKPEQFVEMLYISVKGRR